MTNREGIGRIGWGGASGKEGALTASMAIIEMKDMPMAVLNAVARAIWRARIVVSRAIEAKQRQLAALRDELAHLVGACQGNDRPDCPIMDRLEAE